MIGDAYDEHAKLAAYSRAEMPLPSKYWLWPLYGAGLENLGKDDRPIQVEIPSPAPDQVLVRHDAVGLCFSDTKVIKAGDTHPRLAGRDMLRQPVVLGHEVALTVIQVGEKWRNEYKPGDRFVIQADIYFKGVGLAYGYAIQGGLSQYNLIGEEVLAGDEGSYLLPLQPATGYSQAALTEPWACVVASYDIAYRVGWKPEGSVLIAAGPGVAAHYDLGSVYSGGQPPARVVAMGVGDELLGELKRSANDGFSLIETGAPSAANVSEAIAASGQGGFDDIVLLGADPALYELLEPFANNGCILNIVGAEALDGNTRVDVGRLHYDNISLTGTSDTVIAAAYKPIRTELLPGGKAAFLGAAGPMGQMHFQRALQTEDGPRLLVATDLVAERLGVLETKFAALIAEKRGKTNVLLRVPGDRPPAAFNAGLLEDTVGEGYDDVVVLAPSAGVVAGAVPLLAPNGVMNVFAGLSRGTKAAIDLGVVATKGIRFTGTSGSAIRDMRLMLNQAESGRLDPNLSVAAISGMGDVKKGLESVIHQGFPGKIVVYPQVPDFPLTALEDLEDALPGVYAKLGPNRSWTIEAEAEFLKELLP